MVFVTLPVHDLGVSRAFYAALGFPVQAACSDDRAAAVVVSDGVVLMLVPHDRFGEVVAGRVGDPAHGPTAALCVTSGTPEGVGTLVARALAAGGSALGTGRDVDGVRGDGFTDPDGHVWEVLHVPVPTPVPEPALA